MLIGAMDFDGVFVFRSLVTVDYANISYMYQKIVIYQNNVLFMNLGGEQ